MKQIKRPIYLNKLIERKENGLVKIITGIRRCGKSYLLNTIFSDYLKKEGVNDSHIVKIDFDSPRNKKYHDSLILFDYLESLIKDKKMYYFLLDEIQFVNNFESVLNGLLRKENVDIYVTGSNSKFLSSDIVTEFRGRGDEVRVQPLNFSEFLSAYEGTKDEAWNDYLYYGGMPLILDKKTEKLKSQYLNELFQKTYITDILNRNNLQKNDVLDKVINMLASAEGSLTNINRIANRFKNEGFEEVSFNTISNYVNYLIDSFIIDKVERYDIKGKKYISAQSKYYFADIGLRNARLNFRQIEEEHLLENIIYNELKVRDFNVDVGIVEHTVYIKNEKEEKKEKKQLEVDFVCNQGSRRYYIQTAYAIPNKEKMEQETNSLTKIHDSFKKIVIVKDSLLPVRRTDEGIVIINIKDFLLNPDSLEL